MVNCPKCGQPNRVPDDTPAAAAMAAMATSGADFSAIPEVVVYDDIPDLIAEQHSDRPPPATSAAPAGAASQATASASSAGLPSVSAGWAASASRSTAEAPASVQTAPRAANVMARLKTRPADALLLVTRRAVYAMAGLLFGVAVLAFLAGFLIGRGQVQTETQESDEQQQAEAVADAVALEGSLIYSDAPGHYAPDADSLVLALPVDKQPSQKLSSDGIAATDGDNAETAEAVRELGGALLHADSDGEFQLVVPRSGDYHLLLVSRHAKRPEGESIEAAALNELAAYFANPSKLIGSKKYVWSQRRLSGAPAPIREEFGADGK